VSGPALRAGARSRSGDGPVAASRPARRLLATPWLLLALTGCPLSPAAAQTAADLLSVPVASSEARDYAEFNATIERAVADGESWPQDPLLVARRFAGWGVDRLGIWTIEGAGERPSRYEIVAIADGFHDDSVRGERLEISLERSADETWRITAARVSWRCWPDRGHDSFAVEPCT
jgi:hypothetical protein